METAVITFFSGMLKSFMGTQNPREWSFTLSAPNGELIKCPKGTLLFQFIVNYCIGISLNTTRRWNRTFEEVTYSTPDYSERFQLGIPLIPRSSFTGGTNSGHVDFSSYGLEFITMVILVYVNRLNGIDIFSDTPKTFPELEAMKSEIETNCQIFLNDGFNYGRANAVQNGYFDNPTTGVGSINYEAYLRSWIDYGISIIETDNQFNELLTMALNEDGLIVGTGTNLGGAIHFNEIGLTQHTPTVDLTTNGLVATTNTLSSSNLSKMGIGALILIIFLTFKK